MYGLPASTAPGRFWFEQEHAESDLVYQPEISFLRACGREDLSRKVEWTSREVGDGAGYDIRSFEPDGSDRFLEVKTTVGGARTPFFLSENERAFAEDNPKALKIFRLHDFYTKPAAFELAPPLTDHVSLSPTAYRANLL